MRTASLIDEFIGAEYAHLGRGPAYDCLGLVLAVQKRLGYVVSDPVGAYSPDWADSDPVMILNNFHSYWEPVKEPKIGDAITLCMQHETPDHVGVVVEDGWFLQAVEGMGVVKSKISSFKRRIRGYYRPKVHHSERSTELGEAHARCIRHSDTQVTLTLIQDLFEPSDTKSMTVDLDGDCVADYIPAGWYGDPDHTVIIHNGKTLKPEQWESVLVNAGDQIIVAKTPGIGAAIVTAASSAAFAATAAGIAIATLINIVVAVGLSLLISALTAPPSGSTDRNDSPTFNLSGIRNTLRNGLPIPVVYGTHRVGGQVIQLYNDVLPNGKTTLNMLIALCQGQIQSIGGLTSDFDGIKDASIPDSFMLDGNQMNQYADVEISGRMGQIDQTEIPGFSRNITGVPIEKTLGWDPPATPTSAGGDGIPLIHQTSKAVNEVQVNLFFPSGLFDIDSSGPSTHQVNILFEYRVTGTTTWTTAPGGTGPGGQHKFYGLQFGAFSRKLNIVFPTLDYYDVRITRKWPEYPEDTDDKASQSDVNSINEIVYEDFSYPGLALLAVKALASDQLSGGVPTITSLLEGKLVNIWDDTTPEDNPSFTFQWTDDPAWICYDVLTNLTYGGGHYFSACDPVLSSFKDASDFFAEQVSDGRGSTHKRGSFNFVYDVVKGLWESAQLPLAPFRAGLVLSGRRVRIKLEQESTPVQVFNMANIKRGSFSGHIKSLKFAPNIVEVQYFNEETDYEQDIIQRFDAPTLAAGEAPRIVTVSYPGCTHPARAARAAQYLLNVERTLRRSIAFEAGVDAVVTQPGDVFAFAHYVVGATGGRITNVVVNGNGSLNLKFDVDVDTSSVGGSNRRIAIEAGNEVNVWQVGPAGVVPSGTAVLVFNTGGSPAVSPVPVVGDKYALQADDTPTAQVVKYRCIRTAMTQDLTVEIEGIEYNEDVYDDDPGDVETFTDTLPDPRKIPDNPELYIGERTVVDNDGKARNIIDLSWLGDGDPEVDIYIRALDTEKP